MIMESEHHQKTRNTIRKPGTPSENQEHHRKTRNTIRKPGTPSENQEHHQKTRNTTRKPGTPSENQEHHQKTRNTITKPGTPSQNQEHHQKTRNTIRKPGTPSENQEHHQKTRNTIGKRGTPSEKNQEHHQKTRNTIRKPGTPPENQGHHQKTRNTIRKPGTPSQNQEHHHKTRNTTRKPGTPSENQEHHQKTRNTIRKPGTPSENQEHHQKTRNTTRKPGTPSENQEHHQKTRNTITKPGTPSQNQEHHQKTRNTIRKPGTPSENQEHHQKTRNTITKPGTPSQNQEHHHKTRNTIGIPGSTTCRVPVFLETMNATNAPNSTGIPSTCQASPPDQLTAVSFSVSYGLVLVLAVIGNSLVINFARTNGRMKSNVFNLFLICMATADILDVLIVAPLHWIYFFFVNKWIGGVFGTISCKLLYFLVDVSIFASVLALVAISFDRYFAVCYMNYTPLSRVKTLVIIAGIWAGSCLLSTFTLYKFQIVEFKGQSYCVAFWNNNDAEKEKLTVKYEMSIKFAVSYGIPLLLMIVLYALIIRELRRRLHSCVVEENQELKRQIAQQNRPLVEMFITLVTIFAICWFPVHVNHMLIAFDFQTYLCLPTAVPLVFYLLAHTNAAINPLLYFIFISGFRNELKRNAKAFWNWATKSRQESSHSTSTWLTFFKSRSPSAKGIDDKRVFRRFAGEGFISDKSE
ncbi:hypothetical protein QZH41_007901 [Actinostola sp. cb2023]|nr:hypothetical protein QZH41_007901 [Actinostola sp. cb2023]